MSGRSVVARVAVSLLLVVTGSALFARHSLSGVRIDPAKSWVGLARVHLEVSDLWVSDGALVGTYDIRVPMLPSKNDSGSLRLELPASLDSLRDEGGTLAGRARSADNGATRDVTCDVETGGAISITIALPDRTLEFHSRYHALEPGS